MRIKFTAVESGYEINCESRHLLLLKHGNNHWAMLLLNDGLEYKITKEEYERLTTVLHQEDFEWKLIQALEQIEMTLRR